MKGERERERERREAFNVPCLLLLCITQRSSFTHKLMGNFIRLLYSITNLVGMFVFVST